MLKTKVVRNLISFKILNGCMSLSHPGVKCGGAKIATFEILKCTEMGK